MPETDSCPHWLDRYASNFHHWREANDSRQHVFYRPLGIVEDAFDSDGTHHEGRSDISIQVRAEINSRLSEPQLRQRIGLAWTVLRLHHALLISQAVNRQNYMLKDVARNRERFFVVRVPRSVEEAVEQATTGLVFVEDYEPNIDLDDFHRHAQNCARVIDDSQSMSKLFVLPTRRKSDGRSDLALYVMLSHSISDGMTNAAWTSHFLTLLNTSMADLRGAIPRLLDTKLLKKRLPLAQEDLYPPISGNRARRRWFWLLTIILRHVRKPLPAAFENPLRRQAPLSKAVEMPPLYPNLLDYSKMPPLNTLTIDALLSPLATARLHRLCRQAKSSIGAGCFVLAAVVMMEIHEQLHPTIPLERRQPFIASFPINPRPFFNHHEPPNSLMLSFSDGVVLPFLPSSLSLDGRIRLLVRSAHRQLSRYQKRAPRPPSPSDTSTSTSVSTNEMSQMASRGPGRMIATNYISAVERAESKLPLHLRTEGHINPQGDLPVVPNPTMATCGVSSVGRMPGILKPGYFDIEKLPVEEGEDAFVLDLRQMRQNVRARDGEFLVGVSGDDRAVMASVSYDASAIDEALVAMWKRKIVTLLEPEGVSARL